jgi:hypothetical protein
MRVVLSTRALEGTGELCSPARTKASRLGVGLTRSAKALTSRGFALTRELRADEGASRRNKSRAFELNSSARTRVLTRSAKALTSRGNA